MKSVADPAYKHDQSRNVSANARCVESQPRVWPRAAEHCALNLGLNSALNYLENPVSERWRSPAHNPAQMTAFLLPVGKNYSRKPGFTETRLRPLARRRDSTLAPLLVFMRVRNPCFFERLRRLG